MAAKVHDTDPPAGEAVERWDLVLAVLACAVSLGILLVYRPWKQPAVGDLAMFQVFGRLIADGDVPYRDFFDTKTPFASYLNAFVAVLSDWFGFDYVLGARGLSVALTALGGGMCYVVARLARLDRMPAMVAAVLFLAADGFAWSAAGGFEPKALMWVFGSIGLAAAYRRQWIVSGTFCALALLTWQPAGTFLIGAATTILLVEPKLRVRALAMLGGAFVAPLLIFAFYLLLAGAFDDFWTYTVSFNATYVPSPPWPPFGRWADVVNHAANSDRWLFLVAGIGFVVWAGAFLYFLVRRRRADIFLPQLPLAAVTLSVVSYSSINFAGWGDFFPFVPWVAIWAAWLLHGMRRLGPVAAAGSVLAAVVLVGYGHFTLVDQTRLQAPVQTLGWQRAQIEEIEKSVLLTKNDRLYAVNNMAWYSLLSDHDNTTEFFYTWDGIPNYITDEYGSLTPLTTPLEEGTPKLVVLGFYALPEVRIGTAENYAQIDPNTLPLYFANRAEFWVRKDVLEAGAPVQTLVSESEVQATCEQAVDWQQAGREAGKLTSVSGPVTAVKNGRLGSTSLELGEGKKFFIILDRTALVNLEAPAEQVFDGKTVCARGVVRPQLGIPTITVYDVRSLLLVVG